MLYQHINPDWAEPLGYELYIRRDELIHPLVSGNKWFKLEGWLERFYEGGYNSVLTKGGPYSNHLLAVAWVCAQRGIPCRLLIRGEPVRNHMLDIMRACGAELVFVSRLTYSGTTLVEEEIKTGDLFIPEGGYGEAGTTAYEREARQLSGFDQVWMAVGTGTCLAAWSKGLAINSQGITAHGVVVFKAEAGWETPVRQLCGPETVFQLHYGYHFGGYGKRTQQLSDFMQEFSDKTGILLDPVYTAKALWPLLKDETVMKSFSGQSILFLHTGGITGAHYA